jgi:proline iminopeptidase
MRKSNNHVTAFYRRLMAVATVPENPDTFNLMRAKSTAATSVVLTLFSLSLRGQEADHKFLSQGFELHYTSAGLGTPLIFLSGGPGLDNYLQPVAEHFPSRYRRILLDQRGTGKSRTAELTQANISLRLVVEDLEALRTHLKLDRLFLVGHSWGGMLAMAYAAAHPDRIDQLILIDSGGPTMEWRGWFFDNMDMRLSPAELESLRHWQDLFRRGIDVERAGEEIAKARLPGYFFDRAKVSRLPETPSHRDAAGFLNADLKTNYDVREGLKKLDRPVLIIHGHQDPMGDKTPEDIHALIRNSTLRYINKCGHFPWVEQPEEFHKIINEFFASESSRR